MDHSWYRINKFNANFNYIYEYANIHELCSIVMNIETYY